MANLYEILLTPSKAKPWPNLAASSGSRHGKIKRRFRTLPAISMGLKRSTATPEGLGNLFALMGARKICTRCMMTRRLLSPGKDGKQAMQSYPGCLDRLREPRDRRSGATIVRRQFNHIEKVAAGPRRITHLRSYAQRVGTSRTVSASSLSGRRRRTG